MVEPSSVSWAGNRQMAMVPSWQGITAQHSIQQPMIPGQEWGRPLLVQSAALIQVSTDISSIYISFDYFFTK
jgi:hypothetical protein